MSQAVVTGHDHGPDRAVLPEMHIRATNTRGADVDKTLMRLDLGDARFHQTEVVGGAGVNRVVERFALENIHGERMFL